jgi:hypothetical protein
MKIHMGVFIFLFWRKYFETADKKSFEGILSISRRRSVQRVLELLREVSVLRLGYTD